jgi:hypothetical protein
MDVLIMVISFFRDGATDLNPAAEVEPLWVSVDYPPFPKSNKWGEMQ